MSNSNPKKPKAPPQSQELSQTALGIVQRFLVAVERNDVPAVTSVLAEARALSEFEAKGVDLVSAADEKGLSPLIVASALGHLDMVKALIDFGASPFDLTVNRNTALMLAACYGQNNVVEYFCESAKSLKSNSESKNDNASQQGHAVDLIDFVNEVGQSALMFASRGLVDAVRTLVKYGAKVNLEAKDHSTALHIAAFQEDGSAIMEVLLEACSDLDFVNKADDRGKSALHLCIESKSADMVKKVELLLSNGASPRVRTRTGKTPLDFARYLPKTFPHKSAVVKLLEDSLGPKVEEIPFSEEPSVPVTKPSTPLSTHVAKKVSELMETLKSQKATMVELHSESSSDEEVNVLEGAGSIPSPIATQATATFTTPSSSPSKLRPAPESTNWVTVVKKNKGNKSKTEVAKPSTSAKPGTGFGVGKRHYFNKKKEGEAPSSKPLPKANPSPSLSPSHLPVAPIPTLIPPTQASLPQPSSVASIPQSAPLSQEANGIGYDRMVDYLAQIFPISAELSISPENVLGMNLKDLSTSQLNELQSMYYSLLSKVVEQKVAVAKDLERARCEEAFAIEKDITSLRGKQ